MRNGCVTFAGAGPGAVDLLTIRCRDAIAQADVIVYAGSLVNPEVLQFVKPSCEVRDSSRMTLSEIVQVMVTGARSGRKVLRLHTGDPSIYGAIAEQMTALDKAGVPYEIIPGVSSAFAAVAAVGCELTVPGIAQSVIFARRAGRTPVPEKQEITRLASHGTTMVLYLSAADMPGLVSDLREGGYAEETPVAVVYRASWPDEMIIRSTLAGITEQVVAAGIERQAIVIVGNALKREGEPSRLYCPAFSHSYRPSQDQAPVAPVSPEDAVKNAISFPGTIAVYGLTQTGCRLACKIAKGLNAAAFLSQKHAAGYQTEEISAVLFEPDTLSDVVAENWRRFDGHVFVMATGIVVRKIASLLKKKTVDPAVVVCDETGQFAISLLGGHISGANRLASVVATLIGGRAAITTATDAHGIVAFDELAWRYGWEIINPDAIKPLNSLLLQRKRIGMVCPEAVVRKTYGEASHIVTLSKLSEAPSDINGLVVLDEADVKLPEDIPVLHLRRQAVVVGIGCNRGTSAKEIDVAVSEVLEAHAIDEEQVQRVASIDIKGDEAGLDRFAKARGWQIELFAAKTLKQIQTSSSSVTVEKAAGTPSVSEAAALACGAGRLIVPKQKFKNVTVAVATRERRAQESQAKRGRLFAVGIGPGTPEGLTAHASEVIAAADVVVGYTEYCDQIRWLIKKKRVISSGMGEEVKRCNAAIGEVIAGRDVAVISSGDPGVYGMAGLLLELLDTRHIDDIEVEVVPGVTAATEAAAILGAPLTNDFAVISLSDLMIDREVIMKRLKTVADSGMTCVLYNPRSKKRHEVFDCALDIFRKARGENTMTGFVRHAARNGEEKWVGKLSDLPAGRVDMSTVVIIGSTTTEVIRGWLVERRGYEVVKNFK